MKTDDWISLVFLVIFALIGACGGIGYCDGDKPTAACKGAFWGGIAWLVCMVAYATHSGS